MGIEQVTELLAGLDEGKEHHRFAVTAALGHFGSDLFEVRVQRGAQLAQRVIAAGKTNVGDIQLQWDGLGHDLAQIALLDASVSLYSKARLSNTSPRLRMSPRSGVAVTPSTLALSK